MTAVYGDTVLQRMMLSLSSFAPRVHTEESNAMTVVSRRSFTSPVSSQELMLSQGIGFTTLLGGSFSQTNQVRMCALAVL